MELLLCDICEKKIESSDIGANAYCVTKKIHLWDPDNVPKIVVTLCPDCSEGFAYYMKNRSILKSTINKMTLMNRIRFLFKMNLKDR